MSVKTKVSGWGGVVAGAEPPVRTGRVGAVIGESAGRSLRPEHVGWPLADPSLYEIGTMRDALR
jgi:hypothetical protein